MNRRLSIVAMALLATLPTMAAAHDPTAEGAQAPSDRGDFPLQPHKQNYLLLLTRDFKEHGDRQDLEAKFQFSLKKQLSETWPLFFGFTQKSFWQVYDKPRSAPFRENNYNPEIFADYGDSRLWDYPVGWLAGVEHESNGQTVPQSRSWNRAYLTLTHRVDRERVSIKLWQRFPENRKKNADDSEGDDNPNIGQYLGNWEVNAEFAFTDNQELHFMARKGERDYKGTYQVDYFYQAPWHSKGTLYHVQVFWGYGESLIDYNRRVRRLGLGFAFR